MFVKKSMLDLNRKPAGETRVYAVHPYLIILDDVRSMHNVGSAFRTADSFGAAGIFLCGYTPRPPHRDIHKTALGATDSVAWQHFPDPLEAVRVARQQGYRILAVEQAHGSVPLQKFERKQGEQLALIFGNEVNGIGDAVLAQADGVIEIPQWGSKHSLNISVTIGVVLWELVRT